MKNIKNIFRILLLLFVVSSCDDDEFVPPNEFVVGAFTSSFGNEAIRETAINEYEAFLDLSAGATYHEWQIPEGAFFLKGPIPSNERNFERFIVNPGELITTDRTALVLFPEANSETKVVIYNEFDEPTQFILPGDFVDGAVVMDTVKTTLVNDKHVFTYEINVDVYADVMADLAIRDIDGNNIDFRNLSEIDIKFGDKLIFEDLSGTVNNARPTTTNWRIHTIEDNRDDEEDIFNITSDEEAVTRIDTITFNRRIGRFRGELTASRARTENVRGSVSRLRIISPVFNVTALDAPYTQDGTVEEVLDGTIQIPLSATIADFTNNPASAFTVNVNGSPVGVISVTKSDTDDNVLILTPDGVFDDADIVTVSYNGSAADLQSIDQRPLEAFTDVSVVNFIIIPAVQTGAIVELMDETIQVPFDVAFDPTTFTGDTTQGFEVLVNGIPFPLQSVVIDPTNSNILNIKLNDPIFRPDVITVSHDGSGDIRIVSGGAIGAFTAAPVEMHDFSLLDGSFEDEIGGDTWIATTQAGGLVEFTTEQVFSGSKSAKMVNNRPRLESRNNLINFPAGTYRISYQRFVPTSVDLSALPATVGDKFNVGPKNITITWNSSGPITQGVWEAVEGEITLDAVAAGAFVRIQPVPTSGDLTVFLDDFKIRLKEVRP